MDAPPGRTFCCGRRHWRDPSIENPLRNFHPPGSLPDSPGDGPVRGAGTVEESVANLDAEAERFAAARVVDWSNIFPVLCCGLWWVLRRGNRHSHACGARAAGSDRYSSDERAQEFSGSVHQRVCGWVLRVCGRGQLATRAGYDCRRDRRRIWRSGTGSKTWPNGRSPGSSRRWSRNGNLSLLSPLN